MNYRCMDFYVWFRNFQVSFIVVDCSSFIVVDCSSFIVVVL